MPKKIVGVICGTLIFLCALWLLFDVLQGHPAQWREYREAEQLIRAGDYEKAGDEISQMNHISAYDRDFYQAYCRSYPLYLAGRLEAAAEQFEWQGHDMYYRGRLTIREADWLDWEAVGAIEREQERLRQEQKERERAEQLARAEQREKEYQEKVRSSEMPFLGMREEDVGKTRLGWYTGDVRRAQESYWYYDRSGLYRDPHRVGKREVTHYDFVRNGELVLEVFCTDGTVDELVRYEDGMFYYTWTYLLPDELTGDKKYRNTWNPKGYVATTKKSTRKATARPVQDQTDYANEEDFYEDYADEFEDLDEAMDYYLDHYQ